MRRMMVEWPSKIDQVAVKAMCGMLCDTAIDLGPFRNHIASSNVKRPMEFLFSIPSCTLHQT